MPQQRSPRRSSGKQTSLSSVILLLVLLAAYYAYQTWNENQQPSAQAAQATATSPVRPASTRPGAQATAPLAPTTPPTVPPAAPPSDSITVWFSDPLANQTTGGPEGNLVAAINGAHKTVDMAIYNLTLPNVSSALLNAKKRGVKVRLVMESEAMDKDVPQKLAGAGIPIVGDQKQGLMHNKFTIIDGREVWMGSMNYTSTSAYKDFNNLVRLVSPQIVQDYQVNFNEMFVDHKFEGEKEANTPYPQLTVGGTPVEVYFSPDDGVAQHVTAELNKAQKSITILAYSFTSNDFSKAIRARAKAGVKVRGVFDEGQYQSNTGGEYDTLKRAHLDVRLDGIPGLLHDKVFIIDGQVVITGSYNFSTNAEKTNDENLVILRDAGLASQYLKHFDAVYGSAK